MRLSLSTAVALCCWSASVDAGEAPRSTAPLGAGDRIPVLVVAGSDTFHDWRRTTPPLRSLLEDGGRFDVRVVEDAGALADPALTRRYRTIVLNGQTDTAGGAVRRNLARYVATGGGLVAIHWAIDNFHDWPGFTDVLGRSWQEGTSVEEHGRFRVVPAPGPNPILAGMAPWTTPEGEAIHYRLKGSARVDVLAAAGSLRSAEQAPVAFAHRYRKGRTFFTSLGHSVATRDDPNWRTMILRATEWTATGAVRSNGP